MNNASKQLPAGLAELVASIIDPIVIFGTSLEVLWVNRAFARLCGYGHEDLVGQSFSQVIEPLGSRIFDEHLALVQRGDHSPLSMEIQPKRSTAESFAVAFSFSHLKHQDREFVMARADKLVEERGRFLHLDEAAHTELLNSIQSGVLIIEGDEIRYSNHYFSELCGFEEAELIGRRFFDLIHPDDLDAFLAAYAQADSGGLGANEYEFRIRHKDGLVIYAYMVLGEIHLGGKMAQIASVHNVTMRQLIEEEKDGYYEQLQDQLEYVDNLIERLPLSAWIIDFHPVELEKSDKSQFCSLLHRELGFSIAIRRTNLALCHMLGYSKEEMRGRSILDPMFVDDDNSRIFLDAIVKRRLGERGSYEITMRHKDGHDVPILLEAIPTVFDHETGEASQSIGLMVDLTERKAWEAELQRLNEKLMEYSKTDALTSLANRRSFDEYLNQERNRAIREKWELSLVILDIDYFKKYNDGYGHLKGDECLRKVAEVFRSVVKRAIDMVARYGGEEFAVILPSTNLEGAYTVAEQLRKSILEAEIPHEFSQVGPYLTISIGVATMAAGENMEIEKLIVLADEALYQSKLDGRNRVTKALRTK
ncbi:MAG: diguanylate cyclase [bacterium]|nr:diguanylate cyclase [bacterium]